MRRFSARRPNTNEQFSCPVQAFSRNRIWMRKRRRTTSRTLRSRKPSRIAPQAQQKEGATLFDVEVELDPSSKITLRAGYSANADVIIREKKDVLVIPERLVTFDDGGKKATVELAGASAKDPAKKIEIKTGISDGLNVEVISGLKKGDRVVERPPKEIS